MASVPPTKPVSVAREPAVSTQNPFLVAGDQGNSDAFACNSSADVPVLGGDDDDFADFESFNASLKGGGGAGQAPMAMGSKVPPAIPPKPAALSVASNHPMANSFGPTHLSPVPGAGLGMGLGQGNISRQGSSLNSGASSVGAITPPVQRQPSNAAFPSGFAATGTAGPVPSAVAGYHGFGGIAPSSGMPSAFPNIPTNNNSNNTNHALIPPMLPQRPNAAGNNNANSRNQGTFNPSK